MKINEPITIKRKHIIYAIIFVLLMLSSMIFGIFMNYELVDKYTLDKTCKIILGDNNTFREHRIINKEIKCFSDNGNIEIVKYNHNIAKLKNIT